MAERRSTEDEWIPAKHLRYLQIFREEAVRFPEIADIRIRVAKCKEMMGRTLGSCTFRDLRN
jgi:hypothetical protein